MNQDEFRILIVDLASGKGKVELVSGRISDIGGSGLAAQLFDQFGDAKRPWDDPRGAAGSVLVQPDPPADHAEGRLVRAEEPGLELRGAGDRLHRGFRESNPREDRCRGVGDPGASAAVVLVAEPDS